MAIGYYRAKLNLLHVIHPGWAAGAAFKLFTTPRGHYKKDPPLWQRAEQLWLSTSEGRISGFCWRSEKPRGKKLLIIHGFAGNVRNFDRYVKPALAIGYDVYAYDAPAHGRSDGRRLTAPMYVSVLNSIVQQHGGFDAYMAHSLGGLSLMLMLHQYPQQHTPQVVLIAPATESTSAADSFFHLLQLPPALRKRFDKKVESLAGVPLQWFSISRILHQVNARILWLHDENDKATPYADVYPLLQERPAHVQFHITQGLGHNRIYTDNKVKKLILSFLQGE